MREREVKVTVLGEDKGASKALKQVDDAAAKLGPSGKVAENALQSITTKLTSGLGPASGQAKEALDKVGSSAISSGGALTSALAGGAAVAGAALVGMAVDGIGKLVDLAGEVRDFSRATGLSAEDSSRMVSVLDDLGISADVGSGAMFKLAKNTADGGEKLAQYGITVGRTKDGNVDLVTTLASVADAYVATNDPGKRAELVMAAFGKTGKDLIPILEKGSAGLTAMFDAVKRGEILSQKQIDDTRQFELAIDDVQDSFRSLEIRGASVLLPYVTSVTEAGTTTLDFIDKIGDSGGGGLLGKFAGMVASGTPVGALFGALKANFGGAGEEAKGAAAKFDLQVASLEGLGVEVSDAEKAEGQLTEETKKAAAEAEKYRQKIDSMASSVGSAYTAMSGKANELTDDQRELARGFDTAKTSADQLKQGLDILVGVHISATKAAIEWESQLADTSATLKENKATLDITTEAGRENTSTLLDMIQTGNAHVEALKREGASSAEVTAAYGDHVGALRRVMEQAGYSEEQINALLEKYNLLAAAPDINKNVSVTTTYYKNNVTNQDEGTVYYGGAQQFALGMDMGPVKGPRGAAVPIIAHAGEWVLTEEQMARLRSSAAGGDGAGIYSGGGGWSLAPGSIIIYALDPKAAALAVRDRLIGYGKRVPDLGLG